MFGPWRGREETLRFVAKVLGLGPVGFGAGLVVQFVFGVTAVLIGDGVVRLELDGFVVVLDRAFVLAEVPVRAAPVVVGVFFIGVKLDGFVVVPDGAFVLAEVQVRVAPVDVGDFVIRLELDGLIQVLDYLAVLAKFVVGPCAAKVGVGGRA